MHSLFYYRGKDAVDVFLVIMQEVECWIGKRLKEKKPPKMTRENWKAYSKVKECHICVDPLIKHNVLDAMDTYKLYTGE